MPDPIPVDVKRVLTPTFDLHSDVARAEILAKWLDSQFEVAGVKFGFDALIGLLPVAGDAVSFVIGLYPVLIARRHKLGSVIVGRMLLNLGVDFLAGSVPLVGDALDVFVRSNLKNVALLKKAVAKRQPAALR